MDDSPRPRRRWFQFSLGTMLLLVSLVGVSIFGANEHRERLRLQIELKIRDDARMNSLSVELSGVERAIRDLSRQVRGGDSPALKRIGRHKDAVEAKIVERRAELLAEHW